MAADHNIRVRADSVREAGAAAGDRDRDRSRDRKAGRPAAGVMVVVVVVSAAWRSGDNGPRTERRAVGLGAGGLDNVDGLVRATALAIQVDSRVGSEGGRSDHARYLAAGSDRTSAAWLSYRLDQGRLCAASGGSRSRLRCCCCNCGRGLALDRV